MGLFGQRVVEVRPEHKWDNINLKDFKSTSCFTPFAYGYLWFSLGLSMAVYGVDTFTAINLLAFDRWSSTIQPTQLISFDVTKWIFSICIIMSFVNLAWEHVRAFRVRQRGSVAECYLDSLAVRIESVRLGSGQGWRRFLVFAELTKSKKGAEYVALFTYFSFQSWIRVIFCSGPRQVLNALTLYSVFTAQLFPTDNANVGSTLSSIFSKIQFLATQNTQQAVILSGMLFTLVVWIFSALSLLLAALFFVFFLMHYIPRRDGGLTGYCERKVNKRLTQVITVKVKKAFAKEEKDRIKAELKAAKKTGQQPYMGQQATLPDLEDHKGSDDKLAEMPSLSRADTMTTLPLYTSRPGSPGGVELESLAGKRPMPSRQGTNMTAVSQSSFSSRAPLLSGASAMGQDRSASPVPSMPPMDLNNYPPVRPSTGASNRSFGPMGPPRRVGTNGSGFDAPYTSSPSTYTPGGMPTMPRLEPTLPNMEPAIPNMEPAMPSREPTLPNMEPTVPNMQPTLPQLEPTIPNLPSVPPPIRSPALSTDGQNRPLPRPVNQLSGRPGLPGTPRNPFDGASVRDERSSPAPSMYSGRGSGYDEGRSSPAPSAFSTARPGTTGPEGGRSSPAPSNYSNRGMPPPNRPVYTGPAYSPLRSATNPPEASRGPQYPPQRNLTGPMQSRDMNDFYGQRPGTASSQRSNGRPQYGYNDDIESQRGDPSRY